MLDPGKITQRQLVYIVCFTIVSTGMIFFPTVVSRYVQADAWLSPVFLTLGGLVVVTLFSFLGLKYPDKTIIEYSPIIAGAIIGNIINITVVLFFFVMAAITLRQISSFIILAIMPETPVELIMILMLLLAVLAVNNGIEVIARNSEFLFPIFVFTVTSIFLLVIKDVDLGNLLPVAENGFLPAILSARASFGYSCAAIFILLLIPNLTIPSQVYKGSITPVLLILLIGVSVESATTGVLGALRGKILFEYYEFAKYSSLANFLERTEILFIIPIIMGTYIQISTFLYASVLGATQFLRMRNYRLVTIPGAIGVYLLATYMFDNISDLIDFLDKTFPLLAIGIGFGIPLFLTLIWLLRFKLISKNKKKNSH